MGFCQTCGNEYDKSFEVIIDSQTKTFDCFECAIQACAPRCAHCETRVIGHGVESSLGIFCSAHCARVSGVQGMKDRLIPPQKDFSQIPINSP